MNATFMKSMSQFKSVLGSNHVGQYDMADYSVSAKPDVLEGKKISFVQNGKLETEDSILSQPLGMPQTTPTPGPKWRRKNRDETVLKKPEKKRDQLYNQFLN